MTIQHETILGRTRSGKTYYSIHRARTLAQENNGQAIFFDTKAGTDPWRNWVIVGPENTVREIRAQELAWFVPSQDRAQAGGELRSLVNMAFDSDAFTVFVIDEAQLWAPSGARDGPAQDIARLGAGPEYATCGLFTAQRPADLSKTILTQSERLIVFKVDRFWEGRYWETKVPADAWEKVQMYHDRLFHYAVIEGGEVKGPFKVK